MELCSVCSQLDLSPNHSGQPQTLGPYDEVLGRSRSPGSGSTICGGCFFFCAVLQTSDTWSHRVSELSGRIIVLRYLRLDAVKPKNLRGYSGSVDDLLLDVCTEQKSTDSEPVVDCIWSVPANPLDESCLNLIRSWMSRCSDHDGCAGARSVVLPKRVIEISSDPLESPRLRITHGELGQYVILSHCWGNKAPTKLKDSLIPEYQNGIDREILPKNFRDAIEVTQRLGLRYIWIDALCISQDNAADWAEEAPKMAKYYGQSTLMIGAATAHDSSKGFLTDRDVLYSPVLGKEKQYCLRQRLLRWDWDITRSVLATRGWAAQERMIAPRIVHYTRRQIIWECAEGFRFEASGICDKEIGAGQVDLKFRKEKLQPIVSKALGNPSNEFEELKDDVDLASTPKVAPDVESSDISLDRIRTWQQCVDEYSKRFLTVSSDKLHALSGVAKIMNYDGEMGQYLAGLWSKQLAAGLTWARPWALLEPSPAYRAPSWSWASMDGEVSSTVLASPPELLQPVKSGIGDKWAQRFDLKLVEHRMVLQDVHNVHGPVLEGSYITVEVGCITRDNFLQLCADVYPNSFDGPTLALDTRDIYDCPCCGPSAKRQESSSQDETEGSSPEQESSHAQAGVEHPAPYDLCMHLMADAWRNPEGFVDMLLLCWVDQEAKIAKRVGFCRMSIWQKEEKLQEFNEKFHAAHWERWAIKLI